MAAQDRPLDSDELGNKGEKAFEQLCVDARLICNSAGRDRSGWDYIVEERIDHSPGQSLDKRQNPLTAMFQQKTMWSENDKIKFRLSSLERLAKDSRPSFIYVLKVDNDLNISQAFLIHMMDDVLAFVLGKLREEQSGGRFSVNQAEVILRASKVGKKIEPTGEALLAELNGIVQGDMNKYIDMKRQKLETLGFEANPHELNLTMHLDNPEDMANMFLGLKSSIRVSALENYETRFGIKIKSQDFPADGDIKVNPTPVDKCTLTFRKQNINRPIVLLADVYVVPTIVSAVVGGPLALLKSTALSMLIKKGKITFQLSEITGDSPELTVDEWIKNFRLLILLHGGNFTVDVQSTLKKKSRWELDEAVSDIDLKQMQYYSQCAENFKQVCDIAGLPATTQVSLASFVTQSGSIRVMCGLLERAEMKVPLSFTAEPDECFPAPDTMRGLYIDYALIGHDAIVMVSDAFVRKTANTEKIEYQSEELSFREIDIIPASEYESYTQGFNGLSGTSFVFSRGGPTNQTENVPSGMLAEPDSPHEPN